LPVSRLSKPRFIALIGLLSAMVLTTVGCAAPPPRNSEEYLFNRWLDDQRQQCRQLPEPLSSSCLTDSAKRNYQDFVRQRAKNQQ